MTDIPLVDLASMHAPMNAELHAALEQVLQASAFTGGREVESFEARFAEFLDVPHVVGVASGTSALSMCLEAGGVGPGDEVILPPNTFFATAEAVMAAGATPVLADVDPETALLDIDCASAAVTERTAAIIPVHLYGQPVDGEAFAAFAARRGLFLLEDACQAVGAAWDGRPVGALGDAGALSFYPSKNLGALGDGGAISTHDADLALRVRMLRNHGEVVRNDHEIWGRCERLDGLQAAFLSVKLGHLADQQRERDVAATRYRTLLGQMPGVRLLHTNVRARHVHHLMVVRVARRDDVLRVLHSRGIGASVHYPTPIHLEPAAYDLGKEGQFPAAEALAASVLSLPLWPGMPDEAIVRTVDALRDAVAEVGGA